MKYSKDKKKKRQTFTEGKFNITSRPVDGNGFNQATAIKQTLLM